MKERVVIPAVYFREFETNEPKVFQCPVCGRHCGDRALRSHLSKAHDLSFVNGVGLVTLSSRFHLDDDDMPVPKVEALRTAETEDEVLIGNSGMPVLRVYREGRRTVYMLR